MCSIYFLARKDKKRELGDLPQTTSFRDGKTNTVQREIQIMVTLVATTFQIGLQMFIHQSTCLTKQSEFTWACFKLKTTDLHRLSFSLDIKTASLETGVPETHHTVALPCRFLRDISDKSD